MCNLCTVSKNLTDFLYCTVNMSEECVDDIINTRMIYYFVFLKPNSNIVIIYLSYNKVKQERCCFF